MSAVRREFAGREVKCRRCVVSLQTGKKEQTAEGVLAAQYVRMSTDHQRYSTENQAEVIKQYADGRGIKIVRTYADEGKSGLQIEGRDGLSKLIKDVEEGKADFKVILVYDVSRWGRFQDADESAYYEYICKRAGIAVEYCAEQFENDGSPVSTIVKGVKRAMAGEFSRELSVKVFAGQCRLIELGYRQGGPAGYGLRRNLVDQSGTFKGELKRGEHKSIQTDRVVLALGPADEVETVRWIYKAFVDNGKSELEIADSLNERGINTDLGRLWTRGTVHQVLINEKYIGNNVWNRGSFKLKKRRVHNHPSMWVRAEGVFESVVDSSMFRKAQTIIANRSVKLTDEQMLQALRRLLDERGYLSGLIIDEAEPLPSSSAYQSRFGSLLRAYELVGYTPDRDVQYIKINRELRQLYPAVLLAVVEGIDRAGGWTERDPKNDLLTINGEFTSSIVIVRCQTTQAGSLRWHVRLDAGLLPDLTVVIRMDPENRDPLDYYLLPRIDLDMTRIRLAEHNGLSLDAYRFESLEYFFDLCAREKIPEAA
jgi:DNA invertase Pin-like site-specific DNA recombinase